MVGRDKILQSNVEASLELLTRGSEITLSRSCYSYSLLDFLSQMTAECPCRTLKMLQIPYTRRCVAVVPCLMGSAYTQLQHLQVCHQSYLFNKGSKEFSCLILRKQTLPPSKSIYLYKSSYPSTCTRNVSLMYSRAKTKSFQDIDNSVYIRLYCQLKFTTYYNIVTQKFHGSVQ